jgi:hypothetical protein
VDLDAESWKRVRTTLAEQDRLFRCGLALDPDRIIGRLRRRLRREFTVRLPRMLFRPVDLPAGFRQSVAVEGSDVSLALTTRTVR